MALADWQYRYTSPAGDALTVGDGTPFEVVEIDGLEGFNTRIGDRELPRDHGNVPGLHLATARQILMAVEFSGDDTTELDGRWATLVGTFALSKEDQGTLAFKQPGRPERQVSCRPTVLGRRLTNEQVFLSTQSIALVAADPRIYAATAETVQVPLFTPSGGGLNFPLNFPLNFSAGTSVDVVARNDGNSDAYPQIRFFGPASGTCTGVVLSNRTTGVDLDISATITSGQILTADMSAYVLGNGDLVIGLGGSSRYGDWTQPRTPLALQPGDNLLRFTITGTATVMTATVNFRDTWLG